MHTNELNVYYFHTQRFPKIKSSSFQNKVLSNLAFKLEHDCLKQFEYLIKHVCLHLNEIFTKRSIDYWLKRCSSVFLQTAGIIGN